MFIPNLNAQLKVYNNGNIGIDATDPDSRFSINTDGYIGAQSFIYNDNGAASPRTLQLKQKPEGTSTFTYGLLAGLEYGSGGNNLIAVYGSAYRGTTTTTSKTYGVYGVTGNGTSGYNYAVFGHLTGQENGAAIYGTISTNNPAISGQYAGYFNGNVKITDTLFVDVIPGFSDASLKKDVRNLEGEIVTKLQQLNGVKYKLKHPTELPNFTLPQNDTITLEYLQRDINFPKYTADRIGLIAQDVQDVFPELVVRDNEGYLGINYISLIPVLIEAIKEQQLEIEGLRRELDALKPSPE